MSRFHLSILVTLGHVNSSGRFCLCFGIRRWKKGPRPRYNKETEWNTHGCLSLLCMSIPFGLPAVPEV